MTLLMSFWPSIYDKISKQIKLIEYRRNFPESCDYAYMYISKPIKAICGIIYFGKRHCIYDWETEYLNNPYISERINSYIIKYRYAIEISAFQRIHPITLFELRENIPDFFAPQSYMVLENNPILKEYLKANTILLDDKVTNELSNIFPNHICKEF